MSPKCLTEQVVGIDSKSIPILKSVWPTDPIFFLLKLFIHQLNLAFRAYLCLTETNILYAHESSIIFCQLF